MTATSLAGRRLLDELEQRRGEVDAALALGLLPREAGLEVGLLAAEAVAVWVTLELVARGRLGGRGAPAVSRAGNSQRTISHGPVHRRRVVSIAEGEAHRELGRTTSDRAEPTG